MSYRTVCCYSTHYLCPLVSPSQTWPNFNPAPSTGTTGYQLVYADSGGYIQQGDKRAVSTATLRHRVSIVSPLGSGFVIIVDHLTLSLSAHPLPPPSSRWSNRAGCNKFASADNPTPRQATTDKFVSMTQELGDTTRAGVLSTTIAIRDRARPPQIDDQTLTYHFHNPSLSSERADTSTRSRDIRFSELEQRRENGE